MDFEKILVVDGDVDVFIIRRVSLMEKETFPANVEIPFIKLTELLAVLPIFVYQHVLKRIHEIEHRFEGL